MFRTIKTSLFVFLTVVTITAFSTDCHADTPLVFGGVSNVQPLLYEEDNLARGFFPDIFLEVANRAGFNATVKLFPFKRLRIYLQKGEVDGAISIFYKKEREAYLVYSAAPVLVSRTRAFVKKGNEFPFNTISDLFGKKIGILAGWSVQNTELEQAVKEGKISVDATTHYRGNLKKLIGGRFECLIGTEQVTWYHIHKLGISDQLVMLDNVIAENRTFFAISKHSKNIPDPKRFMEKIDNALNSVLLDGTYNTLQTKHRIKTLKTPAQ